VRSKGQSERKCKNCFSCISSSSVDRFTSTQDQNDHLSILHVYRQIHFISENVSFLQSVICNHHGGPHVATAIWPCTYLFWLVLIRRFSSVNLNLSCIVIDTFSLQCIFWRLFVLVSCLNFFCFGYACWTKPPTLSAFQSTLNSRFVSYRIVTCIADTLHTMIRVIVDVKLCRYRFSKVIT